MPIKVNIETIAEFDEVIERIGKLQDETAARAEEIKALTDLVSPYAVANTISEGVAGDYAYELVGAAKALKIRAGVKPAEAIELLKATPETSGYVIEVVDTKKLKKAFERNASTRKAVEKYGYFFTDPDRTKIKVERRKSA